MLVTAIIDPQSHLTDVGRKYINSSACVNQERKNRVGKSGRTAAVIVSFRVPLNDQTRRGRINNRRRTCHNNVNRSVSQEDESKKH